MWFIPFSIIDLIDILVVAVILFWIYRSTKNTNAPYIIAGILALYILWLVVKTLNMELLSTIMSQIMAVGAVALIVVFQPEIRRFLQMIGMRQQSLNFVARLFGSSTDSHNKTVQTITSAVCDLSGEQTGGLTIVIACVSDLKLIANSGIDIDAKLCGELIKSILCRCSPLNSGALVINSHRVVSANCTLPQTQSIAHKNLEDNHYRAVGLSEISDAMIVCIGSQEDLSEIAVAYSGEIYRNLNSERLEEMLSSIV
ncbi:MAG: diadenylate cyclase [Rikenellaceae bacterium]